MQLKEIQSKNLHHAYVVEGGTKEMLSDFIEQTLQIQIEHNPDIIFNTYERFGVDESRTLKERALSKSINSGAQQIFVIILSGITGEAQNALLKLLEEPTPDTLFFICAPTSGIFLPTILSRVQVVEVGFNTKEIAGAEKFLRVTKKERLDILAPLIKEKDRVSVEKLFEGVERELYMQYTSGDKTKARLAQIVSDARNQLFASGASLKIVAESVALVV